MSIRTELNNKAKKKESDVTESLTNKNAVKVTSISLQLHGLGSSGAGSGTNNAGSSSSFIVSGRTVASTSAMAFYAGDTVKGSVQVNVASSSVPTAADETAPSSPLNDQLFSGFDSGLETSNNSSTCSSSLNGETAKRTDSSSSEIVGDNNNFCCDDDHHDEDDNNFITVTLHGYGKTRIAGRLFRKQNVFINQTKRIPVPLDMTPQSHNLFLFDFKLPEKSLPPSLDGTNVRIRYRISAKYQKLKEVRLPIEIRHNGQSDEKIRKGADDDFDRRNMDLCCFSCGTRSVYAKIERSIFLHQGDVVLIHARFHNLRDEHVQPFVKLVQRQSCFFQWRGVRTVRKSFYEWPLVPDADATPIRPFKDRNWNNARCSTPAVLPSFSSPLVKVDYFLQIGLLERRCIFKNPVVTLGVTLAANSATLPLDRAHLYVSGRKHGHRTGSSSGSSSSSSSNTGPPDSFRGIGASVGTSEKIGGYMMVTSGSQNSYLSAIAEARESESCDGDDEDIEEDYGQYEEEVEEDVSS